MTRYSVITVLAISKTRNYSLFVTRTILVNDNQPVKREDMQMSNFTITKQIGNAFG